MKRKTFGKQTSVQTRIHIFCLAPVIIAEILWLSPFPMVCLASLGYFNLNSLKAKRLINFPTFAAYIFIVKWNGHACPSSQWMKIGQAVPSDHRKKTKKTDEMPFNKADPWEC